MDGNPILYRDPYDKFIFVLPVLCAGGGCEAAAVGVALGVSVGAATLLHYYTTGCSPTDICLPTLVVQDTPPDDNKKKPETKEDLYEDLKKQGFSPTSKSPGGYETWTRPDGSKVTIKLNGEVIRSQKIGIIKVLKNILKGRIIGEIDCQINHTQQVIL